MHHRRGRVLPLKQALVEELQGLLATHHRVLGRAPRKIDPVFLTPRGKPWAADTGNVRRLFHPILKTAGIEQTNEHGRVTGGPTVIRLRTTQTPPQNCCHNWQQTGNTLRRARDCRRACRRKR